MMLRIFNFVAFQIVWIASVQGAAVGRPWLGPLLMIPFLSCHLVFIKEPASEARFLLAIAILGSSFDQILLTSGLIQYAGNQFHHLIPIWIVSLWLAFATTLNISLRWLQGRTILAATIGATGGPFSYWAAAQIGAVAWDRPIFVLTSLAIGWGILFPLLSAVAEQHGSLPEESERV